MMDPIMENLRLKYQLREAMAPKIRELWGEPFDIDITDIETFSSGDMQVYATIEGARWTKDARFIITEDMYVAKAEAL